MLEKLNLKRDWRGYRYNANELELHCQVGLPYLGSGSATAQFGDHPKRGKNARLKFTYFNQ